MGAISKIAGLVEGDILVTLDGTIKTSPWLQTGYLVIEQKTEVTTLERQDV